jgi:hypothetical protein
MNQFAIGIHAFDEWVAKDRPASLGYGPGIGAGFGQPDQFQVAGPQ